MQTYSPEIEQTMRKYYATLTEKDRRRYAAIEALKLDRGGQSYIARVLGCSEKTISRGIADLAALPPEPQPDPRIRQAGGGRKGYAEHYPDIDAQFLAVLQDHTAGDPMDEQVVWTDLTPQQIADLLAQQKQVQVSKTVVRKLLHKHHYRRRKAQKKQTLKTVAHRDEQFDKIAQLKAELQAAGNPIEHRLFPHVTRACQGVIFTGVALVKTLMEKTHTRTGLSVVVQIIDKVYQAGRQVADDFKANMRIVFDAVLPQWNYRALPARTVI